MIQSTSRRQFVRTVAAAGALAATTSSRAFSMSNSEIRLGFIGCGGRGGEHLGVFSKLEGVKIAGLCDADRSKVAAAKQFGPRCQNLHRSSRHVG